MLNKQGQSVMHVASFRAAPPLLQLLVEYGGDVTAECSNGGRNVAASPKELAEAMGKPHNAKYLHELSVALASIRFASRMRAKRASGTLAPEELPSVFHLKIEYELHLFTADLEKVGPCSRRASFSQTVLHGACLICVRLPVWAAP